MYGRHAHKQSFLGLWLTFLLFGLICGATGVAWTLLIPLVWFVYKMKTGQYE